jgi:hypothetical protein
MTRHTYRLLAAALCAALCTAAAPTRAAGGQGDQKQAPGRSGAGQGKQGDKQTGVNPGAGRQKGGVTATATAKLLPRIKSLKTPMREVNGRQIILPQQELTIEGVNFSTVESQNKVVLDGMDKIDIPSGGTNYGPTLTLKPLVASPTTLVVRIPADAQEYKYEVHVEVEGRGRSPKAAQVLRVGDINLKTIEPKHAHRGKSVALHGYFPAPAKVVFEPHGSTYEGVALAPQSIVLDPVAPGEETLRVKVPDDMKVNGYRVSVAAADFSRRTNRRGFTVTSFTDGPLRVSLDNFNCSEESDDGPGSDEIVVAFLGCYPHKESATGWYCDGFGTDQYSVGKGEVVNVGRQLFTGAVAAAALEQGVLFVGLVEMDEGGTSAAMNKAVGDVGSYLKNFSPHGGMGRGPLREAVKYALEVALRDNRENESMGVQELTVSPDETEQALNDGAVIKHLYFAAHEAKYRVTVRVGK